MCPPERTRWSETEQSSSRAPGIVNQDNAENNQIDFIRNNAGLGSLLGVRPSRLDVVHHNLTFPSSQSCPPIAFHGVTQVNILHFSFPLCTSLRSDQQEEVRASAPRKPNYYY